MKAYKGFDENMQCRGMQYVEGETYIHDGPVVACRSGLHACEQPIDVLDYYPPATSVYHEVEIEGEIDRRRGGDSKVATSKLTVGASIGIPGVVKAQVEYVTSRANPEKGGHATGNQGAAASTGYRGAAASTGNRGAAASTGYQGAAASTGDQGAASSTGNQGAAASTGNQGAAASTGNQGAAASTGNRGAAASTGYRGAAASTGNRGAASSTGHQGAALTTGTCSSALATGQGSIAVAAGYDSKAAGGEDCWIVLTERDDQYRILEVRAVKVGTKPNGTRGLTVKPGVFYALCGGKVVKA